MKKDNSKRIQTILCIYFFLAGVTATAAALIFLTISLMSSFMDHFYPVPPETSHYEDTKNPQGGTNGSPDITGAASPSGSFGASALPSDTPDAPYPASGTPDAPSTTRVPGTSSPASDAPGTSSPAYGTPGTSSTGTQAPGSTPDFTGTFNPNSPLLVLVNRDNAIPADYDPRLRSICNGRLKASSYLYDDLCDMLKAAGKDGFQYWISSAYRSEEYQNRLITENIKKYQNQGFSYSEAVQKTEDYMLPAGRSEHHTGLALDILCSTNPNMDETQASEPGNAWLKHHCHEYGFILRYPEDKADITGIKYEPWHFRYVGKEAAKYMHDHDLTLEEFLTLFSPAAL